MYIVIDLVKEKLIKIVRNLNVEIINFRNCNIILYLEFV